MKKPFIGHNHEGNAVLINHESIISIAVVDATVSPATIDVALNDGDVIRLQCTLADLAEQCDTYDERLGSIPAKDLGPFVEIDED